MFRQDPEVVADALREHWELPSPLRLTDELPRGATADIWLVYDTQGNRYVAKFAYAGQAHFEEGLRCAEEVELSTGLPTGRPIRSLAGELTVMLPSAPGEQHPLALLPYIEGSPAELEPDEAADLLGLAQKGLARVDLAPSDTVIDYLTDDSHDIARASVVRPVLHQVAEDVVSCKDLTWGLCYGDGPEVIRAGDGRLALIDWGGVQHAPLLWDVADWASFLFPEPMRRKEFISRCASNGTIAEREFAHLDKLERLIQARALRYRAWKVLRSDHFHETAEADAAEFARLSQLLGIRL